MHRSHPRDSLIDAQGLVQQPLAAGKDPRGDDFGARVRRQLYDAHLRHHRAQGCRHRIARTQEQRVIDDIVEPASENLLKRAKFNKNPIVINLRAFEGDGDPPRVSVDRLALFG